MKRVLTIQDMSCLGKCSLTVALPVISAMGVETTVLPTAVLSTHTGFAGPVIKDLTAEIRPIAEHWKTIGAEFDVIYTGYMASPEQAEIVRAVISMFKKQDTVVLCDPVMADNGRMYTGFDNSFAGSMANLCSMADVIVPNLTEACLLAGVPYLSEDYDESFVCKLAQKLRGNGRQKVIITGIGFAPGQIGAYAYDGVPHYYAVSRIGASYHGTGDIFASVIAGALAKGMTMEDSIALAVGFTAKCIEKTVEDPRHKGFGVHFEEAIGMLTACKVV